MALHALFRSSSGKQTLELTLQLTKYAQQELVPACVAAAQHTAAGVLVKHAHCMAAGQSLTHYGTTLPTSTWQFAARPLHTTRPAADAADATADTQAPAKAASEASPEAIPSKAASQRDSASQNAALKAPKGNFAWEKPLPPQQVQRIDQLRKEKRKRAKNRVEEERSAQRNKPKPYRSATTAVAFRRQAKISPKKMQLMVKVVRRMSVRDAIVQCASSDKKAAAILIEVIRSAVSNAKDKGLDQHRLVIDECFVTPGQYLKRISIHGRGRSSTKLRRRSHITVVVKELEEAPEHTIVALEPYIVRLRKKYQQNDGDSGNSEDSDLLPPPGSTSPPVVEAASQN